MQRGLSTEPAKAKSLVTMLCLLVGLILAACASSAAPPYPAQTWNKVKSPEALGWSSVKFKLVRNYSEEIGSAAVMMIVNGTNPESKMQKKRYLFTTWFVLVAMVFAACQPVSTQAPGAAAPMAQAGEEVVLDMVFDMEPPSLDPSLAADSQSIWVIRQLFVGLTRLNEKAEVVPGLATAWSASEDGLIWVFKLRNDVHWVKLDPASGEFADLGPVTAQDVVYGIKRTLDPNTASDYAYVLYVVQGGEAFNTADPTAANFAELRDGVGVRAIDDTTVEFTLAQPAGYFPSIVSLWGAFPQNQAAVEAGGDKWTEPGSIVTSGPYSLEQWDHGVYLRLVKNSLWIDAGSVQIDAIQGSIIDSESTTALSMYEANEIDWVGPPLSDIERIKADPQLSQELFIAPDLCTFYYGFVTTKPPFDNVVVRKAFAAAIDRQGLIDNLLKGEQRPAHSFAPPGIFGNVADDLSIGSWLVMDNYADQVVQAQQWLADAGYPEGKGLDVLLMYNTSENEDQIAQAVQTMWAEAFPKARITIEDQEWEVYLQTLMPDAPLDEKPDIYRMGWCADYADENNWVNEVFHSESGQNYALYSNPEFDALVEQAARAADPAVRQELYKQAETMFMDDMPIAPIYYYTVVRLYKPWLDVVSSPVTGDPVAQWKLDVAAKNAARGK